MRKRESSSLNCIETYSKELKEAEKKYLATGVSEHQRRDERTIDLLLHKTVLCHPLQRGQPVTAGSE